jgi:hypothetical protein
LLEPYDRNDPNSVDMGPMKKALMLFGVGTMIVGALILYVAELDAPRRALNAEKAAEAAKIESGEYWKTWVVAHPGDPCVPALAELKNASECAGAACSAALVLVAGYQRNCQPEPDTRILVYDLRRKWEKETTSN